MCNWYSYRKNIGSSFLTDMQQVDLTDMQQGRKIKDRKIGWVKSGKEKEELPLLKLWRGNQGSVASVGRGADLQKKRGRTLISDQKKINFLLKTSMGQVGVIHSFALVCLASPYLPSAKDFAQEDHPRTLNCSIFSFTRCKKNLKASLSSSREL
jgi:hypothetical protein